MAPLHSLTKETEMTTLFMVGCGLTILAVAFTTGVCTVLLLVIRTAIRLAREHE